ncbi:hypothetical protein [Bradyrhizobium sp. NAS80.1]|uniref:hypothetical protein n=1 Tax=Bradyrhizobium sp. NAS80.1 TaxID=1680159 RepID=UPI0009FF98D4|nr:hypothetical protein [Bradyrhizobium sp. NAS80.1]
MADADWIGTVSRGGLVRSAAALAAVIALLAIVSTPSSVRAQATADRSAVGDRSDAGVDADDARTDAILGTLNRTTPGNYDNLYATAPGAEQQAVRPQIRFNGLVPLNFDSNPLELGSGSPASWGTFPVANLSAAAPLGDLPFRVSVSARSEFKRFSNASDADIDRLTFSGRVQYVDPANDQAFSPYFAITPRFSYLPTFSNQTEARQDINLGFNKSFHFDGSFQPVPFAADTSAETVWSFGLTAFVQRRLREPQLSSDALVLVPSVSWAISKNWNASFAVELLGRWYEPDRFGKTSRDWEVLPIVTLEYIIPASLFGSESVANLLGRPAIDLQASHLKVWSTVPGVSFNQWEASATLKVGWRF